MGIHETAHGSHYIPNRGYEGVDASGEQIFLLKLKIHRAQWPSKKSLLIWAKTNMQARSIKDIEILVRRNGGDLEPNWPLVHRREEREPGILISMPRWKPCSPPQLEFEMFEGNKYLAWLKKAGRILTFVYVGESDVNYMSVKLIWNDFFPLFLLQGTYMALIQ